VVKVAGALAGVGTGVSDDTTVGRTTAVGEIGVGAPHATNAKINAKARSGLRTDIVISASSFKIATKSFYNRIENGIR
jgi:hypothetical protein